MAVVTALPPTVAPSDELVLARYAAGDRTALDELFVRHRDTAYRVAYRLLGNEADALDAVQDGFIKVLSHLHGFERRSSFKTWLLRVVSNAALDLGRQRSRRDALSLEGAEVRRHEPALPPNGSNAGDVAEQADLRRLLDEALRQLPEAQRRTFVLYVDAELSYREVAQVLGISIGTVMSRLFYARQKLRGLLGPRIQI
jgi:RNA polymerase sigma-70 factor, ECF subfamily